MSARRRWRKHSKRQDGGGVMQKNYYVVLGITEDAPPEAVKSAYRRLVKEYHPDYYGGESGPFRTLQEAYAILSDPELRRSYDHTLGQSRPRKSVWGAEPTRPRPRRDIEPLVPGRGPVDLGTASLARSFASYRPSWEELFDRIWGNFTLRTRPKAERVQSLTAVVEVTPEEAFRGGTVRIGVPAQVSCPTCRGRGGVGPYECWRCSGLGVQTEEIPLMIHFPAQIPDSYAVQVGLDAYGIHDLHLIVQFRVSERL
jgi:DnaJ-class molecular chaperone